MLLLTHSGRKTFQASRKTPFVIPFHVFLRLFYTLFKSYSKREKKEMKWQLLHKTSSLSEGFTDVKAFLLHRPTQSSQECE